MSDTEAPKPLSRYQYEDLRPPAVPQSVLDGIIVLILEPKTNIVSAVISGIKLTLALVYLIARERLLAAQVEFSKQRYELDRAAKNQCDLNKDDLDGQTRP